MRFATPRLGRVLIVVAACALAAGMGYAVYAARAWGDESGRFLVAGVEVEGNLVLTPDEIVDLSGIETGTNLLDVELGVVEDAVASNARVTRARAARRLPDQVVIRLEEKRPAALVARADGTWIEVTADGEPLPRVLRTDVVDLPVITGAAAPAEGETAGEDLRAALSALACAWDVSPELWMDISEIRIAPGSGLIIYTVADGAEVRVGLGALETGDLTRLSLVLADARARERRVESVDLRYDRQVVVRFAGGRGRGGV